MHVTELTEIVLQRAQGRERFIVAIAGPPGSGKSSVADALSAKVNQTLGNDTSIVVPMDGFHLDNSILDEMGQRSVKGAPHTFDAEAFVKLIAAIAENKIEVAIPGFDRNLDKVVAGNRTVQPHHKIILVEGNYLLLEEAPWGNLKQYFDLSVFLLPTTKLLEERLLRRWLDYGYSLKDAKTKAYSNDIPNAKYVLANSSDAGLNLSEVTL